MHLANLQALVQAAAPVPPAPFFPFIPTGGGGAYSCLHPASLATHVGGRVGGGGGGTFDPGRSPPIAPALSANFEFSPRPQGTKSRIYARGKYGLDEANGVVHAIYCSSKSDYVAHDPAQHYALRESPTHESRIRCTSDCPFRSASLLAASTS